MNNYQKDCIIYNILNPTGNITALVENEVEISSQPAVASQIMNLHPEVEQVGFVRLYEPDTDKSIALDAASRLPVIHADLRMAGGEFCGNASMSTAALFAMQQQLKEQAANPANENDPEYTNTSEVILRVSGASDPIQVRLHQTSENCYHAAVCMPPAKSITEKEFTFHCIHSLLPVVHLEGISHIVIDSSSVFHQLLSDKAKAEQAVKDWCLELDADGLGLMFLDDLFPKDKQPNNELSDQVHPDSISLSFRLTPLVYIPGSDTVFWENSCASGTAATGMILKGAPHVSSIRFEEPGGTLHFHYDIVNNQIWLQGTVRYLDKYFFRMNNPAPPKAIRIAPIR